MKNNIPGMCRYVDRKMRRAKYRHLYHNLLSPATYGTVTETRTKDPKMHCFDDDNNIAVARPGL